MTFPRMTVHRAIFWLHLLTGTLAGLVILVMSVTGVLLAFEPQIVDYAERDFRRVTPPTPDGGRLPMDTILAKAEAARPAIRPTAVVSWSEPGATVRVAFGRDDGVFVNPYTGELLGSGSRVHDAMHVIEDWHRWLGSRDVGRPYTGACNLAFLGLAISGLYLWWPRRWTRHVLRGSTLFDGSLRGRARDWNWHNVIGFWCAPVLIVLTVTGAVMSYQWANDLLYRLTGNEPPPAAAGRAAEVARPRGARPEAGAAEGRPRDDGSGRREGERPRSTPDRDPATVSALWARAEAAGARAGRASSCDCRRGPVARSRHSSRSRRAGARARPPARCSPSIPSPPRSRSGSPTPPPTRPQAPHVVPLSSHRRGLRNRRADHRRPRVGRSRHARVDRTVPGLAALLRLECPSAAARQGLVKGTVSVKDRAVE